MTVAYRGLRYCKASGSYVNRESHRGVLLDVNLVVLVEAVCTTWLAVTLNNETFTEPSARTHHSRLTTCVAVTLTNEMLAAALRPTYNSQLTTTG
jgi:hypothetical protein